MMEIEEEEFGNECEDQESLTCHQERERAFTMSTVLSTIRTPKLEECRERTMSEVLTGEKLSAKKAVNFSA